MDDQKDEVGRAVALGEDLIAELQRDVAAASPESPQPQSEGPAFEEKPNRLPSQGVVSLERAHDIAREGFDKMQTILDEQRPEDAVQPQQDEMDIEQRVAQIKERLNT